MPQLHPDKYLIKSTLPGEAYVGVGPLTVPQDAVVRLQAFPAEWSAPRNIIDGGYTGLGVGPYQYTTKRGDNVYASNNPESSWLWSLIPTDIPYTFLVSINPGTNYVWTAGGLGKPITIQPATGGPNQLFTFVPVDEA